MAMTPSCVSLGMAALTVTEAQIEEDTPRMPNPFRPKMDRKSVELRGVPLFSQLSKAEVQWVARQMDEVDQKEGAKLTVEGRPGHTFYVLLEGEVEAAIAGRVVATLGPGDFFGEISLLDGGPATATVTTKTPVRMLVMSRPQFRDAVRSNDDVLAHVLKAMGARLRANEGTRVRRPA